MKQSASVEADDGGDLTFVEVAADGVADGLFEFRDGFGFGEDGGGQGACFVAAFEALGHFEDDFAGFHNAYANRPDYP